LYGRSFEYKNKAIISIQKISFKSIFK